MAIPNSHVQNLQKMNNEREDSDGRGSIDDSYADILFKQILKYDAYSSL
jgi:hypothetical protein